MQVGDESDTFRRLSELQASYEGQSVLRIDAINQRRKSEDKLRHYKKELHSLGRANFKATQAAEEARYSLVRSLFHGFDFYAYETSTCRCGLVSGRLLHVTGFAY